MSMHPSQQTPASIQTVQIIAAALIMGVVMFAGVVAFLQIQGQEAPAVVQEIEPEAEGQPILVYMAIVFGVGAIMVRTFLPVLIAKGMRRQIDREAFLNLTEEQQAAELIGHYQTKKIIEGAILEGAAFFSLIAIMVSEVGWAWAVPVVLVLAMLVGFPTQGGFENWVRMQREMIELEQ